MSVWDDHIIHVQREAAQEGVSNSSINENERLHSIISQLPHQMKMYLSSVAGLGFLFLVSLVTF